MSTNSATKAKHNRTYGKPLLRQTLSLAHSMARIRPNHLPAPTPGPSCGAGPLRSHSCLRPSADLVTSMDVDEDETQSSVHQPISPSGDPRNLPDIIAHARTNRETRVENQDEDLFSRSPSPVPGSLESGKERNLDDDEVELSDLSESEEEEPPASVHLTAMQQLNVDFELQAARAGMWHSYCCMICFSHQKQLKHNWTKRTLMTSQHSISMSVELERSPTERVKRIPVTDRNW